MRRSSSACGGDPAARTTSWSGENGSSACCLVTMIWYSCRPSIPSRAALSASRLTSVPLILIRSLVRIGWATTRSTPVHDPAVSGAKRDQVAPHVVLHRARDRLAGDQAHAHGSEVRPDVLRSQQDPPHEAGNAPNDRGVLAFDEPHDLIQSTVDVECLRRPAGMGD